MAMGGWKETGWRRGRHTSVAQNSSSHDSDLRIIFADAERLLSSQLVRNPYNLASFSVVFYTNFTLYSFLPLQSNRYPVDHTHVFLKIITGYPPADMSIEQDMSLI